MKITVLDTSTLGDDIDLSKLSEIGNTEFFGLTSPEEVPERIKNCEGYFLRSFTTLQVFLLLS